PLVLLGMRSLFIPDMELGLAYLLIAAGVALNSLHALWTVVNWLSDGRAATLLGATMLATALVLLPYDRTIAPTPSYAPHYLARRRAARGAAVPPAAGSRLRPARRAHRGGRDGLRPSLHHVHDADLPRSHRRAHVRHPRPPHAPGHGDAASQSRARQRVRGHAPVAHDALVVRGDRARPGPRIRRGLAEARSRGARRGRRAAVH